MQDVSPFSTVCVTADRDVLNGQHVVAGTRIPAMIVVAYLRHGHSVAEICRDYPALTKEGIRAVEEWAAEQFGQDWMKARPAA